MLRKLHSRILFLPLYFLINNVVSQAPTFLWANSTGNTGFDRSSSIALDQNRNVYATGYFQNYVDFDPGGEDLFLNANGGWDLFISKFDESGNLLWAKSMGSSVDDWGAGIVVDPANGDVITTGAFQQTIDFNPGSLTYDLTAIGDHDVFISRLNSEGEFIWAKALGGWAKDVPLSIVIDPSGSGDIIIAGNFRETVDLDPGPGILGFSSNGELDFFIVRLDASGNLIWAKTFGGPGDDSNTSVTVSSSGEIFATGIFQLSIDFAPYTLSSVGNRDIFILKLDVLGNLVWAKSIGGTDTDWSTTIALESGGNDDVYFAGAFMKTVDFDPDVAGQFNLTSTDKQDAFISKLDSGGNFLWAKKISGEGIQIINSFVIDKFGNGEINLTGEFWETVDFDPGAGEFIISSSGDADIFLARLSSSGNLEWAKSFGGPGGQYSNSIAIDELGRIHMSGLYFSPDMSFDTITVNNADDSGTSWDMFIAQLDISLPTVVAESQANQLSIYPNPARDELIFEFENEDALSLEITFHNILGEVVYRNVDKSIIHKKAIDITSLAPGIYLLDLSIDGYRVMKKVVKE